MTNPDPSPITDLIDAFRRSKAMFTAVSMGVFDALVEAPADAATIAHYLGADSGALERLLDACAGMGFLRKEAGVYSNQPVADVYLRRDSPRTLAGYILYSDELLYPMWAHLDDAIREGTNRWRQTFGGEGPLFNNFFASDQRMRTFLLGMHGFGLLTSPKVVAAFDLSRFRRLADLGGATGHLAIAACERYPELRAVVFDLPCVIEVAREQITTSPARARIELAPGDFFADPLPEADLYYVGRILHDWSEEKIRLLLRKICDSLPSEGGMLIGERLLEDDKTLPVSGSMQSLNMLICTEGRERNAAEYARLLREAGFSQVDWRRTGAPLDAVLALKT